MIRKLISVVLAAALFVPALSLAEDAAAPAAAQTAATDGATGTIVFFREKKFMGAAISYKVREGDVELGKLSSGSFFTVQAPVGKHEYTVHSEAKDVLTMEVESGETYYVVGAISMGVLAGHPNLSPSDKATFDGMKDKLKDVTGKGVGDDKKKK